MPINDVIGIGIGFNDGIISYVVTLGFGDFDTPPPAGSSGIGGGGITGIEGGQISDYFTGIASPQGVTRRTD